MSRNLIIAILTALPFAGGSIFATAHTASSGAAGTRPSFFQHMLEDMDSNGDGKISLDEFVAAATKRFQSIDTQNKNSITAADIAASPVMAKRDERIAQHIVARVDTAGNGYITRDEALAAAKTRFAKLDTSGTGQITLSQFEVAVAQFGKHAPPAAKANTNGNGKFVQIAHKMAQRKFDKLDTNHDGTVTLDEYLAAAGARFDALDSAHTGKVTAQEIAASPKMLRHDEFAARRALRHMGAPADGSVTQDQYLAAAKARFAKLDANGDGFLEADEVTGRRWAGGATKATARNRARF